MAVNRRRFSRWIL